MKTASPLFALIAACGLCAVAAAQTPSPAQLPAGDRPRMRMPMPPPTNLKVLPKTLTGEQVHNIMHKWEGELGVECSECHTPDPTRKGRNGHPALNFPDDSKPEKNTARLMVKMTNEINSQYISMVGDKTPPPAVTCGTCHRGNLKPTAYVPPPHEHDAPPPSVGEKPPAQ